MTKNSNQKEKNSLFKGIAVVIVIVLLVLILFAITSSSDEENKVPGSGNNNLDDTNNNEVKIESKNKVDGVNSVSLQVPSEIMLFDSKGVLATINYDIDSELRSSAKMTVEGISNNFKKSSSLGYSRTGNDVTTSILLELNEKEDIGKEHEYVVYVEYENEIILEERFKVKVLPEYAFAKDLTAEIEVTGNRFEIEVQNYPESLRDKTLFTLKDNGEIIYERERFGYGTNVRESWTSNDPKKDLYINLDNPTIDIYDEVREIYIVKDLSVSFKN